MSIKLFLYMLASSFATIAAVVDGQELFALPAIAACFVASVINDLMEG